MDLGTIEQVVSRDLCVDSMLYIRSALSNSSSYYFLLDNSLVAELKLIADSVYTLHTYGTSRKSGKEKREFFKSIGAQVLEETGAREILVFAPEDRLDLRLFLSSFSKEIAKTRGGYRLHSFTLEDR